MRKVKKYKISRRLQAPLFEKCQTQKFTLREQRRAPKRSRRRSSSDYGKQLAEKQKVRYFYGISERVLKNYVRKAVAVKKVATEDMLGRILESRLDNVVYRLGLAPTRRMARQMVSHGHFTVNGRKVTIPSYQLTPSDTIGIREGSTRTQLFQSLLSAGGIRSKTNWVSWNQKERTGAITGKPVIEDDIFSLPAILEYYSR